MNTLNEQNNLIKTLKNLGLNGMAEAATNQFNNEFSYSELNFCQRLQELLEREDSYRKEMKYQRIIRQGKLKYQLTFNDIHFGEADGLKKDDLKYLISNHWALVSPVNIYIQGKTGVGKTAMSCTLLNNLALEGYTVRFWRMCDLQNEVERLADDPGKLKSFTTKLAKYDVCRRRLSLSVILMPILSVLHRCFHPIMQSIADANFIHRSCYGLVSKNIKKTVELSTVGWSVQSV